MREIIADSESNNSGYAAQALRIGKTGENLATVVLFRVAEWVESFGAGGRFDLMVHPPGGSASDVYPAILDAETYDGFVAWPVRESDLAHPGRGFCELNYYVGDVLAKSATYNIIIEPAISTALVER